jgi:formate dehydrogenase
VVGNYERFATPTDKKSRVRGNAPVAGGHSLAELPAEITTPGPGQIKAMIINCGNPVVSGPDGAALDAALAQLDLLVVLDIVQRESHRHAHWLLPAAHWLERDDLLWVFAGGQDEPWVQYGRRAVDPPPGVREEWTVLLDLALAMKVPMFGKKGFNGFVKATRLAAKVTRRPGLAFHARWLSRLLVATGRKLKWKEIMEHPHGLVYGRKEFGHVRKNLKTPDGRVQLAPPAIVAEARRLLGTHPPLAPDGFPLLMITRRRKDSMNSWLNDLPGLHKHRDGEKTNVIEINPSDAAPLGIQTGDRVSLTSACNTITLPAVVSDAVRPGVVAVEHGWGSRVFDPRGGAEPIGFGANRNLLVSNEIVDPLSQTPAMNSTWVRLEV